MSSNFSVFLRAHKRVHEQAEDVFVSQFVGPPRRIGLRVIVRDLLRTGVGMALEPNTEHPKHTNSEEASSSV